MSRPALALTVLLLLAGCAQPAYQLAPPAPRAPEPSWRERWLSQAPPKPVPYPDEPGEAAVRAEVAASLLPSLHDPSSFQLVSWRVVEPYWNGSWGHNVDVTYRARNAYGGLVLTSTYLFVSP
jgi:hypothetical protein